MSMFTSLFSYNYPLFWHILELIRDLWFGSMNKSLRLCYLYVLLHFFEHDTGILETRDSHRNHTGAVLSLGSMKRSVFPNNGQPTENDGTHL